MSDSVEIEAQPPSGPQQTLYVHNINEKLKIDVLKKMLYMLFSQYGKVTQIVACKGVKMRGQAWIVFNDLNAAMNGLKGKQGFNFYGKPLKLEFAKAKSHVVARKEGLPVQKSATHAKASDKKKISSRATKREREETEDEARGDHAAKEPRLVINTTPHRILFCQNLPAEATTESLTAIAQQVAGFREVRIVPGNRGLGFIEFDNEVQAGMALRQLNGFQLTPTHVLHLTYSKE